MEFKLDESQIQKLKAWQNKIKDLHGEYGQYSYTFTPVGIGTEVTVFSHLAEIELDLSEVDNW